jgi:predicted N-acetyltransferase YhbS
MHEESARVAEYEFTPGQRELIRALLRESVPGYPHRSYFKQLPQFRLLLQRDDELVGQVGVEHRVIRTGDSPLRIFGVIDLCVAPTARSQGLGSRLLGEVETLARSAGVDAIILFADDARLYLSAGYQPAPNPVRWLMINEHESFDVAERSVEGLMVKMLCDRPPWTGSLPKRVRTGLVQHRVNPSGVAFHSVRSPR